MMKASVSVRRAKRQGILQGVGLKATRRLIVRLAADDDIEPVGQRSSDVFVGFAPHDQGMTKRNAFKEFLLSRDFPGDRSFMADDPVFRHGGDQRNPHPRPSLHDSTAFFFRRMAHHMIRAEMNGAFNWIRCYNRSHDLSSRRRPFGSLRSSSLKSIEAVMNVGYIE